MNIEFNIRPRQSGKTIRIMEQFNGNCRSSALIVLDMQTVERLRRKFGFNYSAPDVVVHNILTPGKLHTSAIQGTRIEYDTIYIDEYLLFNTNQMMLIKKFIEYCRIHSNLNKVVIETTSYELYDETELFLSQLVFYTNPSVHNFLSKNALDKLERLRYNLIIHPETRIVCSAEDIKYSRLSEMQYKTEVMGKYLK